MAEYFRESGGQDVPAVHRQHLPLRQAGSEVLRRCSGACPPRSATSRRWRPRWASYRSGSPHAARLGDLRAGDLRPADDLTDPAPGLGVRASERDHDALAGDLRAGHLPGGRPARLDLDDPQPEILGEDHYNTATESRRCCSATGSCRTSSRSSASTSSPTRDKQTVSRARRIQRFLSQAFFRRRSVHGPLGESSSRSRRRCAASARSSTASTTTFPKQPST